jgi:hypothetical protein
MTTPFPDTPKRLFCDEKVLEEMFGIPRKSWQKMRWAKTGPAFCKVGGKRILYEVEVVRLWVLAGKTEPAR